MATTRIPLENNAEPVIYRISEFEYRPLRRIARESALNSGRARERYSGPERIIQFPGVNNFSSYEFENLRNRSAMEDVILEDERRRVERKAAPSSLFVPTTSVDVSQLTEGSVLGF